MDFEGLASKAASELRDADLYLSSFLAQLKQREDEPHWTLNFYNPLDDSMYTYEADTGLVDGPHEVLKQADFVPELELKSVSVSYEDALAKAFEAALPEKDFVRIVVLLQTIDDHATWNITFMNQQFHSLNVRIDAATGRVMAVEPFELFRFDSGGDQEA